MSENYEEFTETVGCKHCCFFAWSSCGVNGGHDCQHDSCFDITEELSPARGKAIVIKRRNSTYLKKNKNLDCKDFKQRTDFWYKIGSKLERFW